MDCEVCCDQAAAFTATLKEGFFAAVVQGCCIVIIKELDIHW